MIRILRILATSATSHTPLSPHTLLTSHTSSLVLTHLRDYECATAPGNSLFQVAAQLTPLHLQMSVSRGLSLEQDPCPLSFSGLLSCLMFFFTLITAYYILIAHPHTHAKVKYHENWALFLLTALAPVPKTGPGTQ